MRNFLYLSVLSVVLMSCEKTVPDPYPIHDPDPSKFYANQTILDSIIVISIAFDSDGTAWIGTLNQGLVKYALNQTKIFDSSNSSILNNAIWDVAVDSRDYIWIGAHGLIKYDGESFTRLSTSNSNIPEDVVWSIAIDSHDDIWVASNRHMTGGVARYNGEIFEVFTPENSPLPINNVLAATIDNEDNVWLSAIQAEYKTYLINISGESWTVYDSLDFIQGLHRVWDIDVNSENQLYGAIDYSQSSTPYNFPHVLSIDGNIIETYSADSLSHGFRSLMVDRNDKIWCAYDIGYAYFDGDRWIKTDTEIRGESSIFTIEQAPDGNIWIGTGKGIHIIEGIE